MDVHALLRMLAEGAPDDRFGAALEETRTAGPGSSDAVTVDDVLHAVSVRRTLTEQRRRETELAALNETATDLASLRDVGQVLQAIVRRARRLLGTDISYLTLLAADDTGAETRRRFYTRVTDGIIGHGFREVRGLGVGGRVLRTKSPYATSDYFTDEQFAHSPDADAAITAVGLVAIVGVPIMLADEAIGVLSAASRSARTFDKHEITLLASLAAHAGVAIENARLFEASEKALRELSAATEELRERAAQVERSAAAHERLTRLVLEGGGVAEVASATARTLNCGVRVLGEDGHVVADARPASDAQANWTTAIVAGTRQLGTLEISARDPLTDVDVRIVERTAQVSALVMLNQRMVFEAEHRSRSEFLADLLTGSTRDTQEIIDRARMFGVDISVPHTVLVLRATGAERHRVLSSTFAAAAEHGGLAADHAGTQVVIVPGARPATDPAELVTRLRRALGARVTAGLAGPAAGVPGLREAYHEASRNLTLLEALGRQDDTATTRDLGVYGLLFGQASESDLEQFIVVQIGPLSAYDRGHHTSLLPTLRAWFNSGGNLAQAAQLLHVHVNTLYQRLDRVDSLIGTRWRAPDGALHLHLALRLDELRGHT